MAKKIENRTTMDGWGNVISGMGIKGRDRKEDTLFSSEYRLSEMICRNLFTYSGLGRRICEMPVADAFRKWFTIDGDTDNTIQNEVKRLAIKQELTRAWSLSRCYGGALIVVMANDGRLLDEPLDETNIRDIEKLRVYHRWRTSRISFYLDPNDPKKGETECFMVAPVQPFSTSFSVHESRCLIFDGVDVAPEIRQGNQWWGDSVFQAIYQRLRGLGESYLNVEHIIGEFLLMIMKIKGLSQKLAEKREGEVVDRIMMNNLTRHLMGGYAIDADGEDATRISATTTGLRDLMEVLMMGLSADVQIPIRKLFGSPIQAAGLGKDGDQETNDYNEWVIGLRDKHAQNPTERLIKLLMLQKAGPFHGKELPNWKIQWNAVQEDSLSVQLANKKTQTEIDRTHWEMGVMDENEIRENRFGGDSYSHDTVLKGKAPGKELVKPTAEDDPGAITNAN
jgi:phage-related protein (TIGR01555 family)